MSKSILDLGDNNNLESNYLDESSLENENNTNDKPDYKVYSLTAILVSSRLTGPLTGTYFMYKNFKNFKKYDLATKSIYIGLGIIIILLISFMFLPIHIINKIPNFLVPAIYISIMRGFYNKYQKEIILKHIKNKGEYYEIGNIIGISLLGLICNIILIFGFNFLVLSFLHNF